MAHKYDEMAKRKYLIGATVPGGPFPVTIASVEVQFENSFVSMREVRYERGGESFQARSVIIMPDGMLVVPVTPKGELIMVKVLRPGSNRWCWEFPQERMESGSVLIEASRCARDEAGLVGEPTRSMSLGTVDSMPDRVTEITHMVAVFGVYDLSTWTDKEEIPDGCIATFTLREVLSMVDHDQITCPCARSALFAYLSRSSMLQIG